MGFMWACVHAFAEEHWAPQTEYIRKGGMHPPREALLPEEGAVDAGQAKNNSCPRQGNPPMRFKVPFSAPIPHVPETLLRLQSSLYPCLSCQVFGSLRASAGPSHTLQVGLALKQADLNNGSLDQLSTQIAWVQS